VQNHDQIGNRMMGERLSHLVDLDSLKVAAGLLLLSPFVPLLFMGQEYADTAPFLYFVSHSDPALVEAVREGRRREFEAFAWQSEVPDPQDERVFLTCKLNPSLALNGWRAALLEWYKTLIAMRRSIPAFQALNRDAAAVDLAADGAALLLRRWREEREVLAFFNLGQVGSSAGVPVRHDHWTKLVDSAEQRWYGTGSRIPRQVLAPGGYLEVTLEPKHCVVLACDQTASQ
jgi:maltooligosyltrehalose trehalohydrolase